MSEEFILNVCKSFQKCGDTLIVKETWLNGLYFCVVSIFLFSCLLFEIKIFFYDSRLLSYKNILNFAAKLYI